MCKRKKTFICLLQEVPVWSRHKSTKKMSNPQVFSYQSFKIDVKVFWLKHQDKQLGRATIIFSHNLNSVKRVTSGVTSNNWPIQLFKFFLQPDRNKQVTQNDPAVVQTVCMSTRWAPFCPTVCSSERAQVLALPSTPPFHQPSNQRQQQPGRAASVRLHSETEQNPLRLARHTVTGRSIYTHIETHTCKSLQRFAFVSEHRSTLLYLLWVLRRKPCHVFGIDVDRGMLQASQQSRVTGLIVCCVSTSCSSLCVCDVGLQGVNKYWGCFFSCCGWAHFLCYRWLKSYFPFGPVVLL